ncbi:MAG: hypothetical protein IKH89_05745 [Bacteroidales bacterium]|jgi:hypothetical protein|nr:hypothetical protein [Bacteroidales bacterium]MBR6972231.1 hypothetical protein [Bacteroidales bacterium]
MKKLFIMAIAAMAFAACGGGSSSANVEPLKEGVKFEMDNFSIMLPTGMEESYKSGDVLNANCPDGAKFVINHFTGGPTKSQLKTTGEGLKGMVHAWDQSAVSEEPVVDGNMVTLKSKIGDNVRYDFTYLKEDKVGVTGNFEFPADKAAQFEDKFLPILKSVVFK